MANVEMKYVVEFLDDALDIQKIPDYSGAHNGLQVENDGRLNVVAAAVDASEPVIRKAVDAGADLLIVHHGLFWQGVEKITGPFYRKIKLALDHNLAIYSAHIPLDIHPLWGNNALLANAIGMDSSETYGDFKGFPLGLKQKLECSLDELVSKVEVAVGGEVHVCPGKGQQVGTVGVITGGAGSEVKAMHAAGIDTFITGEGPHWSYPLAEELGLNVIYGGHYATETFGVRQVSEVVTEKFGLSKPLFIDHPTGL